jgi:hypothetical protein
MLCTLAAFHHFLRPYTMLRHPNASQASTYTLMSTALYKVMIAALLLACLRKARSAMRSHFQRHVAHIPLARSMGCVVSPSTDTRATHKRGGDTKIQARPGVT